MGRLIPTAQHMTIRDLLPVLYVTIQVVLILFVYHVRDRRDNCINCSTIYGSEQQSSIMIIWVAAQYGI